MRDNIIGHTITWQVQFINRLHHPIGVEKSIGVIASWTVDAKFDGAWSAYRKIRARAIVEEQKLASGGSICLCIVFLNKAAGAAYQIEAHQFAPVVSILALLKCGQRAYRTLVNDMKL